jgi:hypothetical protein
MATQKITIKSVTKKTSKSNKPYWSVESNDGKKFSVWEEDVGERISLNEGNTVEVEVMKKDQYSNIVELNKVLEKKDKEEHSSYDTSYAKDILVALIEKSESGKLDVIEASKIAANCVKNIKEILNGNENNQESDDIEEPSDTDY